MSRASNKELIDNILSLPNAPIVLKEVNDKLAEERQRREHFYNEITEYDKAEFINGEVIIHSPVKKKHNDASGALYRLLSSFVQLHQLGYVGYEKIMISLSRNDYEPDLCFFNQEKASSFRKGQSLFPAPDLVVQVLSKRTANNDRGVKFEDYQAHEVKEYWIIDPDKETVEQYRLDSDGLYELVLKANKGTLDCTAVPGFKIAIEAIFDDTLNLQELSRILKK